MKVFIIVCFVLIGASGVLGKKTSDELLDELKSLEENWDERQKEIEAKAKKDSALKIAVEIARERNKPIIGMWGSEYIQRYGAPDKKEISKSQYGNTSMYIYMKEGEIARIVHLKNGKVTSYTDY
jgi:hypothetical protein